MSVSPNQLDQAEPTDLIAGFLITYAHGDFVDNPHDRAKAERLMRQPAGGTASIAYCSRCDLFVTEAHFNECEPRHTIKRGRRVIEPHATRAVYERKEIRRHRSARRLAQRNLFLGDDLVATSEPATKDVRLPRPKSSAGIKKWPSMAPAASLDYVRACTLAREAYRLLVNTSELAWQIYGVTSPQGRDGDKILEVGQNLVAALRADAFDLWVPSGPWAEDGEDDKIFRRFYPARKGPLADLPDDVLLNYGRLASRRRCPKAMPMEAHEQAAKAHREAEQALRQLETLLSPHEGHTSTFYRLKGCRRLLELAVRQRAAFEAALAAEHSASAGAEAT